MRIDRSRLQALAALPDDELWAEATKMAAQYGIALPSEAPPHDQLQQLRELAMGSRLNLSDAVRLINQYKTK